MVGKIRQCSDKDYARCEELVNQAWSFDNTFQPKALSAVAKKIYTQGSIDESTYRSVAELDGQVVGLIFGMNEHQYRKRLHLGLRLSIVWKILRIKESKPEKKDLITVMAAHEKNRSELTIN